MGRFVNTEKVLAGLTGWGGGRVFVLAGEKDRLMSLNLMGRMAEEYRAQRVSMFEPKTNGIDIERVWGSGGEKLQTLGGFEGIKDGIAYRVVAGSGHHSGASVS
ncbi:hypothetical protein ABW19_dt0209986 [Dactylella cylindrospora]|nr:hypothetical protein ABW19_dt0209986 [Dactylella cylindrospora]